MEGTGRTEDGREFARREDSKIVYGRKIKKKDKINSKKTMSKIETREEDGRFGRIENGSSREEASRRYYTGN